MEINVRALVAVLDSFGGGKSFVGVLILMHHFADKAVEVRGSDGIKVEPMMVGDSAVVQVHVLREVLGVVVVTAVHKTKFSVVAGQVNAVKHCCCPGGSDCVSNLNEVRVAVRA